MDPYLWELFEYGEADDEVAAIIRLGHYAALPKAVRVVTQFEEIVTVRLARRDIPTVSGAPEVPVSPLGIPILGRIWSWMPPNPSVAEICRCTRRTSSTRQSVHDRPRHRHWGGRLGF